MSTILQAVSLQSGMEEMLKPKTAQHNQQLRVLWECQ